MTNRVVLALSFSMLAMFSASAAHADDDIINSRIEKAEQLLLGKTSADQPVESRLDAVEMNLYGKTKHGSVTKRIDSISDFLGIKSGSSGDSAKKASSESNSKPGGDSVAETKPRSAVSEAQEPARFDEAKSDAVAADAATASASKPNVSTDADAAKSEAKTEISKSTKTTLSKKISGAPKIVLTPLKPQEAKMAVPPTAPKPQGSAMPPAAPSISSTMNKTGANSQARDLLRDGLRQYSMGQHSDAESTFRRVLTVDPRNADAFYNLGSLAERNHEYLIALTNYRAALNFNSKDKDYISAVTAMEHQLSASAATSGASARGSTNSAQTATFGHFQVPVDASATTAPIGTDASGKSFQLSGTQNDVLMNTTQFSNNNYSPTMSVNQQTPPPTMGAAPYAPKKKSGLGTVLNVGMRAALYSSGLHCPICRMTGGGFHF